MDDPLALLCLQIEWGADEALEADPIDRLRPIDAPALVAPPPARRTPPVPIVPPTRAEAPVGSPGERGLAAAAQASTLEELRAAIAAFDGCSLRDTATHLVFAEGDPDSDTLIIGEPPGRDEDRSGHPFAGAEGQLLDQMLASIGLSRSALMLTPLTPWRPPGGRPTSQAELTLCLPFLHRLIALLGSARLVLFGPTAARALFPPPVKRRQPVAWAEVRIPGVQQALPSLPLPSMGEMLKTPDLRRDAWAGLRLLRRTLDSL